MIRVKNELRQVATRFLSPKGWFTLADGLTRRRDNFLLLRLIAAAMVISGHSYTMTMPTGRSDFLIAFGWEYFSGMVAVDAFFLMSGFMITGSYLRRRGLVDYAWARFLRLFPAYAVCVILSAFVLGAIFTAMPLRNYLLDPATHAYAFENLKFGANLHYKLPGVFMDNPRLTSVNGSLWTLPIEVRMYTWVAVLGMLGILMRRRFATFLLLALIVAGVFAPDHIPMLPLRTYLRPAGMFALGALCYLYRERIPAGFTVFALLAGLCWLLKPTPLYPFAFALALAAFVFCFAYRLPLFGYNRFGDYSYGVYIWGFPVQQSAVHLWPGMTAYQNMAIAMPIALALGIISWHVIEKPALSLKGWPGHLRNRMPDGWSHAINAVHTRVAAIGNASLWPRLSRREPSAQTSTVPQQQADESAL